MSRLSIFSLLYLFPPFILAGFAQLMNSPPIDFDIGTSFGGVFQGADYFHEQVDLYWIGCGEQDFLYEGAQMQHLALTGKGIQHEWHVMQGSHEWQVWRRHLYEFAQKVFQP